MGAIFSVQILVMQNAMELAMLAVQIQ